MTCWKPGMGAAETWSIDTLGLTAWMAARARASGVAALAISAGSSAFAWLAALAAVAGGLVCAHADRLMAPSMAMSKRFIWGVSPGSMRRSVETGAGTKGSVDCRTQVR